MQRCTGSYSAEGDDGRSYTVEAWTNFVGRGNLPDPAAEVAGAKTLCTSDGQSLNRRAKGEYVIVATGVVLRSNDPNAP